MMTIRTLSVFLVLLAFTSCHKDNPVAPQTPQPKTMLVSAYGEIIDSLYYKLWSDSSWSKYGQTTAINGFTYVTVLNNDGNEYYYGAIGYSGFKPKGGSLILFDKPLASLPDTLVFGTTYTRQTTFFYQGYNYTLKYDQTFQDTVSVSVPIGIFNPCLQFNSVNTVSAGGQSDVQSGQFWLAKGPGEIKETLNSGVTIAVVKARVNGQAWGIASSNIHQARRNSINSLKAIASYLPLALANQSLKLTAEAEVRTRSPR